MSKIIHVTQDFFDSLPKSAVQEVNGEKLVEIVTRRANKTFKTYYKLKADRAGIKTSDVVTEVKGVSKQVTKFGKQLVGGMQNLDSSMKAFVSNIDVLGKGLNVVQKLSWLNTGLNVMNIAETAAGFAVVCYKLDEMKETLNQIMEGVETLEDMRKEDFLQEYNELVAEFYRISDAFRVDVGVTDKDLDRCINHAYAFLLKVEHYVLKGIIQKDEGLLLISTLLPMFTELICRYLKQFFLAYGAWPSAKDGWVKMFEQLSAGDLVQGIQDYYFLEKDMHTGDVSELGAAYLMMVNSQALMIEDMEALLTVYSSQEVYSEFEQKLNEKVEEEVEREVAFAMGGKCGCSIARIRD